MSAPGFPTHLAVFAKYWEPGQVKTRLAAKVGHPVASEIHREFLSELIRRLSDTAVCRTLVFWPPDKKSEFQKFVPAQWEITCQAEGDLGAKLSNFFQSRFAQRAERIVAIGADSPDLPQEFLVEAFHLLDTHKVVLGPSTDGGYYLVGQNSYVPIFDNVTWSTAAVFTQTVENLRRQHIEFGLLKPWEDVDEWSSLASLQQRLRDNNSDPNQSRLFERLKSVLGTVPL